MGDPHYSFGSEALQFPERDSVYPKVTSVRLKLDLPTPHLRPDVSSVPTYLSLRTIWTFRDPGPRLETPKSEDSTSQVRPTPEVVLPGSVYRTGPVVEGPVDHGDTPPGVEGSHPRVSAVDETVHPRVGPPHHLSPRSSHRGSERSRGGGEVEERGVNRNQGEVTLEPRSS